MKTQILAALMTLLPGVAAAQVHVSVGIPSVQVSVNGPPGEAPGPGYVWEPARWVYHNGTQVYQQGYWRQVAPPPPPPVMYESGYQPAEVIIVDQPPPPPVVEVRPAMPYSGAIWVAGYWNWQNRRHHWMRGHWTRPRAGHVWQAPRWERQGSRWASYPGRWQRDDRNRHDDRRQGGYRRNNDDNRRDVAYRSGHHQRRNR